MMYYMVLFLFLPLLWPSAAVGQLGSNSQINAQPVQYSQPGVQLRGRSYGDLYAAEKVIVSNYCRLDFEGVRLQSGGWERFRPYTAMHANPEYTRIEIVTRFDIEAPSRFSDELEVNFQSVGYYQLEEGYTADSSKRQAVFRLQERNGSLLVTELLPDAPRVSPRAAIAWMNRLLDDPKTSAPERAHLKDALGQLNKYLPAAR